MCQAPIWWHILYVSAVAWPSGHWRVLCCHSHKALRHHKEAETGMLLTNMLSIAWYNAVVSLLLTHWRYSILALSHWSVDWPNWTVILQNITKCYRSFWIMLSYQQDGVYIIGHVTLVAFTGGLLLWCPIFDLSHSNLIDYQAPIDFIYRHPVLKMWLL